MSNHLTTPVRATSRVLDLRRVSPTGYVLTLERAGIDFRAGQLVTVHGGCVLDDRSYTICSGERDDHLQILFRLIPAGRLTPRLAALAAGDPLDISGPYGEFTLRDPARPVHFIATGTGVAPCRAFLRTHAGLRLTLLHGVRCEEDLFFREEFAALDYHPCVSAGSRRFFPGRVTACAAQRELPADAHYYLCGANEMFYEMREVLVARSVPAEQIFTEAYYYRGDE